MSVSGEGGCTYTHSSDEDNGDQRAGEGGDPAAPEEFNPEDSGEVECGEDREEDSGEGQEREGGEESGGQGESRGGSGGGRQGGGKRGLATLSKSFGKAAKTIGRALKAAKTEIKETADAISDSISSGSPPTSTVTTAPTAPLRAQNPAPLPPTGNANPAGAVDFMAEIQNVLREFAAKMKELQFKENQVSADLKQGALKLKLASAMATYKSSVITATKNLTSAVAHGASAMSTMRGIREARASQAAKGHQASSTGVNAGSGADGSKAAKKREASEKQERKDSKEAEKKGGGEEPKSKGLMQRMKEKVGRGSKREKGASGDDGADASATSSDGTRTVELTAKQKSGESPPGTERTHDDTNIIQMRTQLRSDFIKMAEAGVNFGLDISAAKEALIAAETKAGAETIEELARGVDRDMQTIQEAFKEAINSIKDNAQQQAELTRQIFSSSRADVTR